MERNQFKTCCDRGFTLMELLVVVVIIGVLSAVVLPKFTKVLETRKVTEAEEIMAAVRNEQEARCTLGKNYITQTEKLASLPGTTGKNFTYNLQGSGVAAVNEKGYELRMPSYADGRVCCSGVYCNELNKSYPSCEELQQQADYVASDSACTVQAVTLAAPEAVVIPEPTQGCSGEKPAEEETCECGKRTREVVCNESTHQWETGEWDRVDWHCSRKAPSVTGNCYGKYWCPNGISYTCNETTGNWTLNTTGCRTGEGRSYASYVSEDRCDSGYLETRVVTKCTDEDGWGTYEYIPGGRNCIGNSGFLCQIKCGSISYRYDDSTKTCTCPGGKTEVFDYKWDDWLWGQVAVDERYIDISWTMAYLPSSEYSAEEKDAVEQQLLEISGQTLEEYCREERMKYRRTPQVCQQ